MTDRPETAVVHRYLRDAGATWSVAVFGAIAEFSREEGEEATIETTEGGGTIVTDRGACRIDLSGDVRMLPYEFLSKRRDYWLNGIAFCLPDGAYPPAPGPGLREVGVDSGALRPVDAGDLLFDLGLGLRTVTAMVRTGDPELIARLRSFERVDILGGGQQGHAAFSLLQEASPHRVFDCPLGRVEVYLPIPSSDAATPHGPHTHILPNYLASGRTHSANVPIPDGWLPCLQLSPPHPILTHDGEVKPSFDRDAYDTFQSMLKEFGASDLIQAKEGVETARAAFIGPPDPASFSRAERTAIRVALRQAALIDPGDPVVMDWQAAFEPMHGSDEPDPDIVD